MKSTQTLNNMATFWVAEFYSHQVVWPILFQGICMWESMRLVYPMLCTDHQCLHSDNILPKSIFLCHYTVGPFCVEYSLNDGILLNGIRPPHNCIGFHNQNDPRSRNVLPLATSLDFEVSPGCFLSCVLPEAVVLHSDHSHSAFEQFFLFCHCIRESANCMFALNLLLPLKYLGLLLRFRAIASTMPSLHLHHNSRTVRIKEQRRALVLL